MSISTVKVNNISLGASQRDIQEFFSFSGDIQYVELQMETERTQLAYITLEDSLGYENSILLSGAIISKRNVSVMRAKNYRLPLQLIPQKLDREPLVKKTEEVVSTVLAKGFVMGKDAVSRAKAIDEQYRWLAIGVFDRTKSVYAVAEKTVSAAENLSAMRKDKMEKAELEKEVFLYGERMGFVNDFARMELDDSPKGEPTVSYGDDFRLEIV